ncbi:hypothetical protein P3S67_001461 [Capsicum chacoense]
MELIKKELAGATSVRRAVRQGQPNVEALHDQPQIATDSGVSSGVLLVELFVMVAAILLLLLLLVVIMSMYIFENTPCTSPFSHPYTGPSYPYSGPSHPSSPSYSYCKCKVCKDREDRHLEKLEAIVEAADELKSRKGVIPSNEVRESCTPTVEVRRKRRKIRQILSILKSTKIATPPTLRVFADLGPPKKVDIFAALDKEKKKELEEFIKMKVQREYTMLHLPPKTSLI